MKTDKRQRTIPRAVLARLTRYLACVKNLAEQGVEWVSSQEMAELQGVTMSTVRQDLLHVDFRGVSKRGYKTAGLCDVLTRMLGADRSWRLAVVGAGNMGKAIALHGEFQRRGFRICAIFDTDPRKVGKRVGSLRVQGIRVMPRTIVSRKVDIAVIAVPAAAAQSVADLLIASGVRGLVNLAMTHIVVPKHVVLADARIIASLLEVCHGIKGMDENQRRVRGRAGGGA